MAMASRVLAMGGVRYEAHADPVTAELATIARAVTRLRRQIVMLYGAVIAGSVTTLDRTLGGAGSRFAMYWVGVFAASIGALAMSTYLRARLTKLLERARVLGIR